MTEQTNKLLNDNEFVKAKLSLISDSLINMTSPPAAPISPRLLSLDQLMDYTGLGKLQADRLGQAAGAKVRQGRRVLYDKHRIDQHINTM